MKKLPLLLLLLSAVVLTSAGITKLQRFGLTAGGTYGKVDDLTVSYSGNRMTSVSDAAPTVTQTGSMDFAGGSSGSAFGYNGFGALTSDASRGITSVTYDGFGNPLKISYSDGSSTQNVYSATGEKLKSTHAVRLSTGSMAFSAVSYRGPAIYIDGRLYMVLFPGGYASVATNGTVTFHYYTQDYLGNNRAVINGSTGAIEQTVAYYPYGGVIPTLGNPTGGQPYKFGGKELVTANGLNEYDFGARQYWSAVPGFTRIDPLCEDTQWLSPYLYCGNNPVNAIDPDGRSTWVTGIGNGVYQIIGGNINDNDVNIYIYEKDKNGNYSVCCGILGQTTSITSFFNSDYNDGQGKWMTNSFIDTSDCSGEQFMFNLISDDPSLKDYMDKAQNGNEYDFKATNGNSEENLALDHYRGMSFGYNNDGIPIYTSARDIGNIAAGYTAAKKNIPWFAARGAFDSYQSIQSKGFTIEGVSTRNAERYGYDMFKKKLSSVQKTISQERKKLNLVLLVKWRFWIQKRNLSFASL